MSPDPSIDAAYKLARECGGSLESIVLQAQSAGVSAEEIDRAKAAGWLAVALLVVESSPRKP